MHKDVLAQSAYGRYNIYLVQLVGLEAAVYWEVIYAISDLALTKSDRKQTIIDGYFGVDRTYVRSRTGLSTEKQRILDKAFAQLGVLIINPTNPEYLSVDNMKMLQFLMGDDKISEKKKFFSEATSTATKEVKAQKSASKKEGMINRWLSWVTGSDSLKEAYSKAFTVWYGMNIQTDVEIQARINLVETSSTDESFKILLLNRAVETGYKDISCLIWNLKKDYNPMKNQRISDGAVSSIKF